MFVILKKLRYFAFALFFGVAVSSACRTATPANNAATDRALTPGDTTPFPTPVVPSVPVSSFSVADIAKLKWIEGSWRASGDNMEPSFERYKFDGDTTLAIESFNDEKMDRPTEVSRFELKDGQFQATSGSSRWTASEITDDSVTFVRISIEKPKTRGAPAGHPPVEMPDYGARSIRWIDNRDGTWRAVVDWPDAGDQKAMQKVFLMEPVSGKK